MKLEIAATTFARLKGLLGRTTFDGALLLVPCNDIHTFGMRRPIDVAFVAGDGTVIASFRDVGPNRRLRNREAAATVERFSSPSPWLERGDAIQHSFQ